MTAVLVKIHFFQIVPSAGLLCTDEDDATNDGNLDDAIDVDYADDTTADDEFDDTTNNYEYTTSSVQF